MDIRKYLLNRAKESYQPWYEGVIEYQMFSDSWQQYIRPMLDKVKVTPENYYKVIIDLYIDTLLPTPEALSGFDPLPLVQQGESIAVIDPAGNVSYPIDFEVLNEGQDTVAAVFSRSLFDGVDNCVFIWSNGQSELWQRKIPYNYSSVKHEDYKFVEANAGYELVYFKLKHKQGLGPLLAPQQARINHSIIDQAAISEQYTRPFWYLLKYQKPISNPYATDQKDDSAVAEAKIKGQAQRLFTTSAEGPFGQLQPPDLNVMLNAHKEYVSRIGQIAGIPSVYLTLNSTDTPSGVALMRLNKRFEARVGRMRQSIEPQLRELNQYLGGNYDDPLWPTINDEAQEALDSHGLSLYQMGYPLEYIAEVVTPGVDLANYTSEE